MFALTYRVFLYVLRLSWWRRSASTHPEHPVTSCPSEQPASVSGSVPPGCEQRIRSDCCFSLHEKKSSAHHLLPVTLLTAPEPRPHCKPARFISTANGNLKHFFFSLQRRLPPLWPRFGFRRGQKERRRAAATTDTRLWPAAKLARH